MNRLKRKLTSQTGASITYALLLFLVCAVVSSVVLAAGTAASGRISGSAESDQRYYCVSSAVELLKNYFSEDSGKNSVTIVERMVSVNKGVAASETGYPTIDNNYYNNETGILSKEDGSNSKLSILQEAAAYYKELETSSEAVERNITLTVGGETSLTANIKETLDPASGRVTFAVTNTDTENPYTITMIYDMVSKVKRKTYTDKTRGTGGITKTKTVETTTTMTWSLTSMG